MKKIKRMAAAALIILSLIFSLWLAIGVMLVGGIEQVVIGAQINNGSMIAWGIVRALFFEFGFLPFWVGYIAAICLMDS